MLLKVRTLQLIYKSSFKCIRKYASLSYIHNVGQDPLKPLTVGKLLQDTCQKHGETLAIVSKHQNRSLNFLEVLDEGDRLAAGLLNIGLQYGDRVGIWAPNLVEWYVANMACARAGFITVPINPAYQPRELEYCINKVGIKGIICGHKFKSQNYYEHLQSICPELSNSEPAKLTSKNTPSLKSVVIISDENLRGAHSYKEILDLADESSISYIKNNQDLIKMDNPCNIQFTSGTTGHPKAAIVSHFQMVNNGFFVGKRNELGKKHQKICVQVPFFHAFGLIISISAALNYGATLVLPSLSYNPEESLDALKEEQCSVIHGTPTMYVDLINVQRRRKEKIYSEIAVSGGASCSPILFKEMLEVLNLKKVKSVYGLTEATAVVFQSIYDDDEFKSISTVGHIQEHMEAKVIDIDGNIVPFGSPGELCVRGYSTMLEYFEDEKKTKEMLGPDQWLHTGDQFILEENGYGRVVGRLKEMIIRAGENIYPKEIEDYLNTYPDIIETHVLGIPHERLGEEVCACVRVKEGHTITHEEIVKYCKGNIAHFKIPSVVKIVDSFPKTASGKIQKFKILDKIKTGEIK